MAEDSTEKFESFMRRSSHLDAHHRLLIAGTVAVVIGLVLPYHMQWSTRILGIWDAYVYTVLGLIWATILTAEPKEVVNRAKLEDNSRAAIFIFVIAAACASVFAVPAELGTAKGLGHAQAGGHVVFAILTVVSSWVLIHTVFTLRYAHIYYDSDDGKTPGGLNFPDEPEPDYLDFAYFSFVIGMTSQVSDVSISAAPLRRLALVHGLISFVFNVVIIALTLNALANVVS